MKELITLSFIIVLLIIILVFGIHSCNKELKKDTHFIINKYIIQDSIMKSNLGKQIVLHKDTFIITDYSILNNNYTIQGMFTINSNLIDSLKIN